MGSNVNITCLCGKSEGTVSVASQSLPVETLLCHCNICRYTSGIMCVSYLTLASPPGWEASLITYQSSAKMQRKFCVTCGAHVFAYDSNLDEWYVATGVIETLDQRPAGCMMQATKHVKHEYVSDTLDGGLAPCLATISGRQLTFHAQGADEEPMRLNIDGHPTLVLGSSGLQAPDPSTSQDHLGASCHCGGVQFKLSRPNDGSRQLSSPWPDLLVPYHSGSPENEEDIKWWLRSGNKKYLAGTCACRSCRLASGFSIQAWAFVPKSNITTTDGRPLSFSLGTLRQYESTHGIYREFCGKCGATVFWHCDQRPDLLDVSVGLLRAEEGSRAEKWLEWWRKRVSFREDAIDTELVHALESGLIRISGQ